MQPVRAALAAASLQLLPDPAPATHGMQAKVIDSHEERSDLSVQDITAKLAEAYQAPVFEGAPAANALHRGKDTRAPLEGRPGEVYTIVCVE